MSDRIKLAEAMGYEYVKGTSSYSGPEFGRMPAAPPYWKCPGKANIYGPYGSDDPPFNPFVNANDDYAVLEWMRDQPAIEHKDSYLHLPYLDVMEDSLAYEYEIGDYARAALKVIDQGKSGRCKKCGFPISDGFEHCLEHTEQGESE